MLEWRGHRTHSSVEELELGGKGGGEACQEGIPAERPVGGGGGNEEASPAVAEGELARGGHLPGAWVIVEASEVSSTACQPGE